MTPLLDLQKLRIGVQDLNTEMLHLKKNWGKKILPRLCYNTIPLAASFHWKFKNHERYKKITGYQEADIKVDSVRRKA